MELLLYNQGITYYPPKKTNILAKVKGEAAIAIYKALAEYEKRYEKFGGKKRNPDTGEYYPQILLRNVYVQELPEKYKVYSLSFICYIEKDTFNVLEINHKFYGKGNK